MPMPDFRTLDSRIDDPLNDILHRALARDLDKRYSTADELLYDLEHYIYHSGYGPTTETLGKFMRELYGPATPPASHSRPAAAPIEPWPSAVSRPALAATKLEASPSHWRR